MDSRGTLDLITELEERYPVDTWTVGELHVWPIMRMRLATALVFHGYGTGLRGAGSRTIVERATGALGDLSRLARNRWSDHRANATPGRADVVMLSDGVSLSQVEGEWYDRFMDPIVATLAEKGRHSLLLMPQARGAVPRHTPSFYIQPFIDARNALTTASARVLKPLPHRLEGMSELLGELRRRCRDVEFPQDAWLPAQSTRVLRLSGLFSGWLERTDAKAAFVNTYYSAMGMAFVHAARRLDCLTIDVQHGLQYEHMAYGRWMKAPAGGYEVLPDEFWCWGDDEVSISNDGPGSLPAHRAVRVGNPWDAFWADSGNAMVARARQRVRDAKARFQRGYHFLLTPSWGQHPSEMDKLVETARLGRSGITWWLRLHPIEIAARESIRQRLAEAGVDNVEIDLAIDAPLPLLLSEMDVNVTPESSTVIDGATAGVPSVVATANGASLFRRQIADGHCRFAEDPAEILAAALELARDNPLRKRRGVSGAANHLLAVAIDRLFEPSRSA